MPNQENRNPPPSPPMRVQDGFFPQAVPVTQEDYDAAVKRAEAAEDHLRREVASSQALQAENSTLRTDALARDVLITDLLLQTDALKATITEREQTLEAWASAKARDASFIADLRADLNAERTARQDIEATHRNLLATLAARDAQIEEMRGQIDTLAAQVEATRRDPDDEPLIDPRGM